MRDTRVFMIIVTAMVLVGQGTCKCLANDDQAEASYNALLEDHALARPIRSEFHEERINHILAALERRTGVRLSVTAELSPRRLTGRCRTHSVAGLLIHISHVIGASLRTVPGGYEIYQTDEQKKDENRAKRLSEIREANFLHQQAQLLKSQVIQAIAQGGRNRDPFADYLAQCDAAVLENGLQSALEDEPILSAVDQSHYTNHFIGASAFAALSPAQQNAVSQIAAEAGLTSLNGSTSVGLIAAAGSYRLGVTLPDGDLWVSPQHSIGRVAAMNINMRENDFDPEVVSLLQSAKIAELSQLPDRYKQITVTPEVEPCVLSSILSLAADAAAVDFVSDCYINSNTSMYGGVFPRNSKWTIESLLVQVARSFAHKIRFRNGWLEATTIVRGLDLRMEPSPIAMNSLDTLAAEHRQPNRDDILALSECSKDQLGLLHLRHPAARTSNYIIGALRVYPFLNFYAALRPEQKRKALSADGVSVFEMSRVQVEAFNRLLSVGIPRVAPAGLKKARYYVKCHRPVVVVRGDREVVSFIAVANDNSKVCREEEL